MGLSRWHMLRSIFVVLLFLAFVLPSQAQSFSHGIPASVVSPEPDGRQHGVPASVVSPTPLPFGVNPPLRVHRPNFSVHGPMRRFGGSRHRPVFVPVPIFYSYYTDGSYPSAADPYVPETPADPAADAAPDRSEDELRSAYLQGAHDALAQQKDSRYGEHYMDSRERNRQDAPAQGKEDRKEDRKADRKPRQDNDTASAKPAEDKSPATVFIFKDGHQLETRNYAIMGQTLFDFSDKMLKKIELNELDTAATMKANDDRGLTVKLN
jgi:hypothetical protein